MATAPRIGLACPVPGERAEFLEWLSGAGYDPVPMLDPTSVARELESKGFQALIADQEIVTHPDAPLFMRSLGKNRPLIIVGDEDRAARTDAQRRNAAYLARPVQREEAMLAVTLALAEGRPARRSPRRPVARIPATVDGVPSSVLDVSYDGIRLAVPEQHRTLLPPSFTVRVPMFRVTMVVQRVWVNNPLNGAHDGSVWCGVALRKAPAAATEAWRTFVDHAPASASFESEARRFL
jgi:hypothetical protein